MQNSNELKEVSSVARNSPSPSLRIDHPELNQAYQRMAQKVRLKGFRRAKYRVMYWNNITRLMSNRKSWSASSQKLRECSTNTRASAQPKVDSVAQLIAEIDFSFTATVGFKPEIEMRLGRPPSRENNLHC